MYIFFVKRRDVLQNPYVQWTTFPIKNDEFHFVVGMFSQLDSASSMFGWYTLSLSPS